MIILFILLILFFPLLVAYFNFFIFCFTHLKDIIYYTCLDIYNYFKYKKYNNYNNFGKITMFVASGSQVFGSGKTLSMIKYVSDVYNRYDGKLVWSKDSNRFVRQTIHIISNVDLKGIPFTPFTTVNQFVDLDRMITSDAEIFLFCLDESGAIFNSREFRDNISPEFLNRLLQSRKHKVSLFMTSQRYNFTDKILRQICGIVVECHKTWRFCRNRDFNALDLEYALNPSLVRPKVTRYFLATQKLFDLYNTNQVAKLDKRYSPEDFLTTEEILATYGTNDGSIENSTHIKKKYNKNRQA